MSTMDENVTDLGPVCEGCGKRTARPTWAGMDPFCPACAAELDFCDGYCTGCDAFNCDSFGGVA